MTKKDKQIGLM